MVTARIRVSQVREFTISQFGDGEEGPGSVFIYQVSHLFDDERAGFSTYRSMEDLN